MMKKIISGVLIFILLISSVSAIVVTESGDTWLDKLLNSLGFQSVVGGKLNNNLIFTYGDKISASFDVDFSSATQKHSVEFYGCEGYPVAHTVANLESNCKYFYSSGIFSAGYVTGDTRTISVSGIDSANAFKQDWCYSGSSSNGKVVHLAGVHNVYYDGAWHKEGTTTSTVGVAMKCPGQATCTPHYECEGGLSLYVAANCLEYDVESCGHGNCIASTGRCSDSQLKSCSNYDASCRYERSIISMCEPKDDGTACGTNGQCTNGKCITTTPAPNGLCCRSYDTRTNQNSYKYVTSQTDCLTEIHNVVGIETYRITRAIVDASECSGTTTTDYCCITYLPGAEYGVDEQTYDYKTSCATHLRVDSCYCENNCQYLPSDTPVCGNQKCETGETYSSCPQDCINPAGSNAISSLTLSQLVSSSSVVLKASTCPLPSKSCTGTGRCVNLYQLKSSGDLTTTQANSVFMLYNSNLPTTTIVTDGFLKEVSLCVIGATIPDDGTALTEVPNQYKQDSLTAKEIQTFTEKDLMKGICTENAQCKSGLCVSMASLVDTGVLESEEAKLKLSKIRLGLDGAVAIGGLSLGTWLATAGPAGALCTAAGALTAGWGFPMCLGVIAIGTGTASATLVDWIQADLIPGIDKGQMSTGFCMEKTPEGGIGKYWQQLVDAINDGIFKGNNESVATVIAGIVLLLAAMLIAKIISALAGDG